MSGAPEWRQFRAARAILALAVGVACLGSVAYAASRPDRGRPHGKHGGDRSRDQGQRPPRPLFIEVPPAVTVGNGFQFRFHVAPPPQRPAGRSPRQPAPAAPRWRQFQCRGDGGGWAGCSSPRLLGKLGAGEHSFAVRALSPRGIPGPAAHYHWTQLEPKQFTIDPLLGSLEDLMPGDPPQQLPVRIGNPNPVPIEVTNLTVAVTPDRPGCAADPNFAAVPSSLTPTTPLSIPAGGSIELPSTSASAPSLALRELPVDQNACQGATLRLAFSGEARG